MYTQTTDWGFIEYCDSLTDNGGNSLCTGITTLLPGMVFPPHIHYGQEQVVYIVEGEGVYIINGERHPIAKGDIIHMPADAVHETVNTGNCAIRELFVNSLARYEVDFSRMDDIAVSYGHRVLMAAIQALKQPLLCLTSVPFTIVDEAEEIIFQSGSFNHFCTRTCRPPAALPACYKCLHDMLKDNRDREAMCQTACAHGLTVYAFPIVHDGHYLGTVYGGHVMESKVRSCDRQDGELRTVTDSNVMGAREYLRRIVKSILSFCSFYSMYQNLQDRDAIIQQAEQNRSRLEENLSVTQDVVTNLRINHHFLFNTLNAIARMTIDADRDDIYNAIADLAKMLRYTTNVDSGTMPLCSELEYLDIYLRMQRLRYGEALQVHYDIEKGLDRLPVPFNFLQPIVENAFVHGLTTSRKKLVKLRISRVDDVVEIEVRNNGTILGAEALEKVRQGMRLKTGHGLSLIYSKLFTIYKNRFFMDIDSTPEKEVRVLVRLPYTPDQPACGRRGNASA